MQRSNQGLLLGKMRIGWRMLQRKKKNNTTSCWSTWTTSKGRSMKLWIAYLGSLRYTQCRRLLSNVFTSHWLLMNLKISNSNHHRHHHHHHQVRLIALSISLSHSLSLYPNLTIRPYCPLIMASPVHNIHCQHYADESEFLLIGQLWCVPK